VTGSILVVAASVAMIVALACGSGGIDLPVTATRVPTATAPIATAVLQLSQIKVATTPDAPAALVSCRRELLPYMVSQPTMSTQSRQCELHDSDRNWLDLSSPDASGVLFLESVNIVLYFTGPLGSLENCDEVAAAGLLWPADAPPPPNAFRGQCKESLGNTTASGHRLVETLAPLPASASVRWIQGSLCSTLAMHYGGVNDNPTPFIARCILMVAD
jgi:hypothetical protein